MCRKITTFFSFGADKCSFPIRTAMFITKQNVRQGKSRFQTTLFKSVESRGNSRWWAARLAPRAACLDQRKLPSPRFTYLLCPRGRSSKFAPRSSGPLALWHATPRHATLRTLQQNTLVFSRAGKTHPLGLGGSRGSEGLTSGRGQHLTSPSPPPPCPPLPSRRAHRARSYSARCGS